jgi:hypothetical protein
MKKYVLKCRTFSGNILFFCHQYVAGTKQNVFVSQLNHSLFYLENQIGPAELELIRIMSTHQIKSYVIEIL